MARRASSAFGEAAEGLWSDGQAVLPLLVPEWFLPLPSRTALASQNPHHTGTTGEPLQFA